MNVRRATIFSSRFKVAASGREAAEHLPRHPL
jgi:hypothetical protein